MSIIIAAKTGDCVTMICDSLECAREQSYLLEDEERYKIQMIGNVLVGSAGKVRAIRRLISHPEWFDTDGKPFDKRFIVTEIVPKFFKDLDEYSLLKCEKGEIPSSSSSVLMACEDRLFLLKDNFSVFEIDKCCAIGCTKYLIDPLIRDPEEGKEFEVMLSAMRLSSELSPAVGAPYYYADTKTLKYEMIKE